MRSKSFSHGRSRSLSDQLAKALLPPPDETPEDRERRLRSEQEAQKVSDPIDEQIKLDRQAFKKQKQAIKVLLLGQSESGKSTTLKQFQLLHTPAAFHAERIAWRAVIYLNLIRSIRRILDALLPPSSTVTAADPTSVATAKQSSSSAYQNGVYHYQNNYGTGGVTGYRRHFWSRVSRGVHCSRAVQGT